MKDMAAIALFAEEILKGLKAKSKFLPSKYFYDTKGDELFREIMYLEEYYLTRKELEIIHNHKALILDAINDGESFRIIELGAGDGLKTKVLLKYFLEKGAEFTYTPVDISGNVLEILEKNLKTEIPGLKIERHVGDYLDALNEISSKQKQEKDIVFFLGSNIGNFPNDKAVDFLSKLKTFLKPNDILFMGVDLKKDPSIILSAYNDSKGVTTAFNLHLLDRINGELDGNFDRNKFQHYPHYNPHTGECRSYLIAKEEQLVTIGDEQIMFDAWEPVFMEVSKKYDDSQLKELADKSGFTSLDSFYDQDKWFTDVLWKK